MSARVAQSYTNNEVTPLSKERIGTSLQLRWEDVFGAAGRTELTDAQGKSLIHGQRYKSKELVKKWVKYYFSWKWGRLYRDHLVMISKHARDKSRLKLPGLKQQIQQLRWSEIHHKAQELLSAERNYGAYFMSCSERASFSPQIEVGRKSVVFSAYSNETDKDLRVYCESEKKKFRMQMAENFKRFRVNIGTGYGLNQQLGTGGRQFSDVRAAVELQMPLDFAAPPEVTTNHCEFEIRQLELEGLQKKEFVEGSLDRFDKSLASVVQMNTLMEGSKDVWNNFSDPDASSFIAEYLRSVERLAELDYELSSELLANSLVEKI